MLCLRVQQHHRHTSQRLMILRCHPKCERISEYVVRRQRSSVDVITAYICLYIQGHGLCDSAVVGLI